MFPRATHTGRKSQPDISTAGLLAGIHICLSNGIHMIVLLKVPKVQQCYYHNANDI